MNITQMLGTQDTLTNATRFKLSEHANAHVDLGQMSLDLRDSNKHAVELTYPEAYKLKQYLDIVFKDLGDNFFKDVEATTADYNAYLVKEGDL